MRPAIIEARGLRYRYGDGTQALDGVDFEMAAAECVVLLGANGSGKTTFVLHLNGLLAGEGSLRVCGMDVSGQNLRAIRQKVGIVFQESEDQLFMPTVLSDVAFGPLNLGVSARQAEDRARSALERVGMGHTSNKAPYHLSAGEKKRVAIAGILAMEPDILVLDEPTTYLDPPTQRALIELLHSLPQAKVVVTHDLAFANAVATRAVFFQNGRIFGAGTVDELVRRFAWTADPDVRFRQATTFRP